jgi:hypothetical protein
MPERGPKGKTMTDPMKTALARTPDFVARQVAGELLLVPVRAGAIEIDSFFRLNETGAFIVGQIDGVRTGDGISQALQNQFEVDSVTADRDTSGLLKDLLELGFIRAAKQADATMDA